MLESIRLMAVERVREGERASSVISSYGFNRTTIFKRLAVACDRGKGLKALRSRPATGRPRTLFAALLKQMMRHRSKPAHLVVDGLPAHQTKLVKEYAASTGGRPTLHFLPGYAPERNPDELV